MSYKLVCAQRLNVFDAGAPVAHNSHIVVVNIASGYCYIVRLRDSHAGGVIAVVASVAKNKTVERPAGTFSAKLNNRSGRGTGAGIVDASPVKNDGLIRIDRLNCQVRLFYHQFDFFVRGVVW